MYRLAIHPSTTNCPSAPATGSGRRKPSSTTRASTSWHQLASSVSCTALRTTSPARQLVPSPPARGAGVAVTEKASNTHGAGAGIALSSVPCGRVRVVLRSARRGGAPSRGVASPRECESPSALVGNSIHSGAVARLTRLTCDGSASSFSSARMSDAGLRVKRTPARSRSRPWSRRAHTWSHSAKRRGSQPITSLKIPVSPLASSAVIAPPVSATVQLASATSQLLMRLTSYASTASSSSRESRSESPVVTPRTVLVGRVPTPKEFGAGSSITANRGGGIPPAMASPSRRLRSSACASGSATTAPVSVSTRRSSIRRAKGMRTTATIPPTTNATTRIPAMPIPRSRSVSRSSGKISNRKMASTMTPSTTASVASAVAMT